jgi:hypothetical protein
LTAQIEQVQVKHIYTALADKNVVSLYIVLKHIFFFQNLTLGYMTKTLNQIIFFFPPPKSEYFFQQHWESEYLF